MEQPRVLVCITAYNRPDSLWALVSKLLENDNCDIRIFDDATPNFDKSKIGGRVMLSQPDVHCGKPLFWKVYNEIFSELKYTNYDYYIILPDDVEPCPEFVKECIAAYENAGKPICLSPLVTNRTLLPGISRWGRKPILRKDNGLSPYYETHYFDCCGIMRRDFFEALDWHMLPILPSSNPFRSSGVGRQITTRLQAKGKRMCHVGRTLLSIVQSDSQMNPEERKRHPMVAHWEDNYNCVDVHMASLYRGGHLLKTLQTIARQPEVATVYVTLNSYTQPQYNETLVGIKALMAETGCKIITRRAKNQKGSNEKLSQLTKSKAPYIAFADDDILYPQDYFLRLIHGLRLHNAAVCFHGGVLKELPTKQYYNGGRRMYSWNISVPEDVKVDIMGTGVGLLRREWFTYDELLQLYNDAPEVSMDDLIVSCALSKKGISRWVLAHASRVITTKKAEPDDGYVYDQYKDNDCAQVAYINEHLKR